MSSVCIYFQVHQPKRIKKYRVFDVGVDHNYFNGSDGNNLDNKWILDKVANKSYIPTNKVILDLLKRHKEFKVSYSLSGIFLEQVINFEGKSKGNKILDSFKKLVDTGRVELLSETYYHSLAFFYSPFEFEKQVELHRETIRKFFGVETKVFRNTELAYNNDLAKWAEDYGFDGILAEGWDSFLGWRSPNFLYSPFGTKKIKLFLKNYKLSDDVAFRFSDKNWKEWPLTSEKFAKWISNTNGNGEIINLFMDYETFGEHQWSDTGIFEFLLNMPNEILKHPDNNFVTPSEAIKLYTAKDVVDVPYVVTWADTERDLSAWRGNSMQDFSLDYVYSLEKKVLSSRDKSIVEDWRRLQTSDHFYYMCTKWFADGDVHTYFSPYESPYDAFICFVNAIKDLELRLDIPENTRKKRASSVS